MSKMRPKKKFVIIAMELTLQHFGTPKMLTLLYILQIWKIVLFQLILFLNVLLFNDYKNYELFRLGPLNWYRLKFINNAFTDVNHITIPSGVFLRIFIKPNNKTHFFSILISVIIKQRINGRCKGWRA